jgi:hypothetical protein
MQLSKQSLELVTVFKEASAELYNYFSLSAGNLEI